MKRSFSLPLLLAAGLLAAQASHAQPAPAGPVGELKKSVAVDAFQATEAVGGAITAEGMTTMLTNALVRDGRFVVLERTALGVVQAEQALGTSGAVQVATAPAPGQLLGASAVVRGVVTSFQPNASGGGINVGVPLFGLGSGLNQFAGTAGIKNQSSTIDISLRLVDATTGQVLATASTQGVVKSSSLDAGIAHPITGLAVTAGTFKEAPIGKAGEEAIAKAVELLAAGMAKAPWSALVIDAANGRVFVNAGADRNLHTGLALHVYRKGRVLSDPVTGVVLDVDLQKIGLLRVDGVREKVSTAVVESGEVPQRGDLLRLE